MGEWFWPAFAIISIVAVVLAAFGRYSWIGVAALVALPVITLTVRWIWQ